MASARSVPGSGAGAGSRPAAVAVAARVDDDVRRPGGPAGVEELHGRRHRRGRVGPDQQDRLRLGDVGERERQAAVDAEGPVARGGGRRHAEPAVVVDRRRAAARPARTCRTRTPSRWSARRRRSSRRASRPCSACGRPDARRRSGRAPRPSVAGAERAGPVAADVADQRGEQPLRVVEQLGRGPALGAEPAAVDREVGCGSSVAGRSPGRQRDPALQRAVRAVRLGRPRAWAEELTPSSLGSPVTAGAAGVTRRSPNSHSRGATTVRVDGLRLDGARTVARPGSTAALLGCGVTAR